MRFLVFKHGDIPSYHSWYWRETQESQGRFLMPFEFSKQRGSSGSIVKGAPELGLAFSMLLREHTSDPPQQCLDWLERVIIHTAPTTRPRDWGRMFAFWPPVWQCSFCPACCFPLGFGRPQGCESFVSNRLWGLVLQPCIKFKWQLTF